MILLVDNYDSFVHNLARYFRRLGQETVVVRNDALDLDEFEQKMPDAVVLSPGPRAPREAGCSLELVRRFAQRLPMLGVCLGHQVIAEAFGGQVVRAEEPVHGRTSTINHEGGGLFDGLPPELTACRYHSLVVDELSLPDELLVRARTPEGVVMAIEHCELPVFGVQFHPESILTDLGYSILNRFCELAGLGASEAPPTIASERIEAPTTEPKHDRPVTF